MSDLESGTIRDVLVRIEIGQRYPKVREPSARQEARRDRVEIKEVARLTSLLVWPGTVFAHRIYF